MTEPFTNVVQELIPQYTLWLPGNQIMSGIGPQISRSRNKPGSRQTFQIMSRTVRHNGYLSHRIFASTIASAIAIAANVNAPQIACSFFARVWLALILSFVLFALQPFSGFADAALLSAFP